MRSWDLHRIEMPGGSRSPVVLHSDEEGRAVLIGLEPGQELGDHQVKEHAFVIVLDGSARFESGGETFEAGARILLLLAPWPGEGHYRGEERSAR